MFECSSITSIQTGALRRHAEVLLMPVQLEVQCTESDERKDVNILVAIPCVLVRENKSETVRKYVYDNMKHLMIPYGPISFQKLVEVMMERLARTDMRALAGEQFLMDMVPAGYA